MLQAMELEDIKTLKPLLLQEVARNYFLLLALEADKQYFSHVYVESRGGQPLNAGFFRHSGTFQCYLQVLEGPSLNHWRALIQKHQPDKLIIDHKTYRALEIPTTEYAGQTKAYIASLDQLSEPLPEKSLERVLREEGYRIKPIELTDLEALKQLYSTCFDTFPKEEVLKQRYRGRGRGLIVYEGPLAVATVSTEYETADQALIVGVATRPEVRGKGLASLLVIQVCEDLLREGKSLWLQYDNPSAGRIYERIGFRVQYEMIHALRV